MRSTTSNDPRASFFNRRYVELLTVLAFLFILQTGLIPFDLDGRVPGERFAATSALFSYADVVSNMVLYFPLGFLLNWSLRRVLGGSFLALLLSLVGGTICSGAIEWLQSYSPSRVSSVFDLISNVVGTAIGSLAFVGCQALIPQLVRTIASEIRGKPLTALVKGYVAILIIAAAIPFSFSLNANLLNRSLKRASLVPFASVQADHEQADQALAAGEARSYAMYRWRELKHYSRWAAEMGAFLGLVLLTHAMLRREYRFGRKVTFVLVSWYGVWLAVLLSALQFFVVSRGIDVTDILFRLTGLAVGLVLVQQLVVRDEHEDRLHEGHLRRLLVAGRAGALLYIVYIGMIPFTVDLRSESIARSLFSQNFLPFFGSFATRFDFMIDDVLEKTAAYAVLGALVVGCSSRLTGQKLRRRVGILAMLGAALATPIELVQAYIPVRVFSLTDLILAAGGCMIGVIGLDLANRFYRSVAADASKANRTVVEWASEGPSPADQWLDTLQEPSESAPQEPSPTHPPVRKEP